MQRCGVPLPLAHPPLAWLLVLALVLSTGSGHAGVHVVDHDVLARAYQLHLHGALGEAQYVRMVRAPAPFVGPHCHMTWPGPQPQPLPRPDEVLSASTLAGATLCPTSPVLSTERILWTFDVPAAVLLEAPDRAPAPLPPR